MTIGEGMMDPTGDVTYTVKEVHPSYARPHEALCWLDDAASQKERPFKSFLWDKRRHGPFPKVGDTIRLPGVI